MKVYKVVRVKGLWSVRQVLRYSVGQWMHTPESFAKYKLYLTCFQTYETAETFRYISLNLPDDYITYECEARKIFPPVTGRMLFPLGLGNQLSASDLKYNWPEGTMMCKAIKLKEVAHAN